MSIPTTRQQHSRTGLRSSIDLTDAEWVVVRPLLPAPALHGRPSTWSMREILNAIFSVLRDG
jgi:putative transposase